MSFNTKGVLKSGDKAGAGTPRKKRVHFADERVASEDAPAIEENSKKGGDETQAGGAHGWAHVALDLADEFRTSCDVNAVKSPCRIKQEAMHPQGHSFIDEDRELKLNSSVPNLKFAALMSTSLRGEAEEKWCIEDERACTPPSCVTYGLACSKNVPPRQARFEAVQRKLELRSDSFKQCYRVASSGFPTKKSGTRAQNSHYKVVPEVEACGLSDVVPGRYELQMQAAFEESCYRKRCAWITSQSDPAYVAYHDEEWGVPVHDDRRLFELLVFAGAQAEVAWPCLLAKRELYRNVFHQFDPTVLASYNATEMESLRSHDDPLRSEARVQAIVNNAKLVVKIVQEFGLFDAYMWSFVGNTPIVNNYKQPNLIPARTAKSVAISKDLQRRGFRHAGPVVVYALMQAAGLANAHLVSCFRHHQLLPSSSPSPCSSIPPRRLPSLAAPARKSPQVVSPLCY